MYLGDRYQRTCIYIKLEIQTELNGFCVWYRARFVARSIYIYIYVCDTLRPAISITSGDTIYNMGNHIGVDNVAEYVSGSSFATMFGTDFDGCAELRCVYMCYGSVMVRCACATTGTRAYEVVILLNCHAQNANSLVSLCAKQILWGVTYVTELVWIVESIGVVHSQRLAELGLFRGELLDALKFLYSIRMGEFEIASSSITLSGSE